MQGCVFPVSAKMCGFCLPGYLMNDKKTCDPFPLPQIENCFKYKAIDECLECKSGFFFKNSKTCVPVKPIENCESYDGTQGLTICKKCTE